MQCSPSYLALCRNGRQELASQWQPAAGDWVLKDSELALLDSEEAARLCAQERPAVIWVPRLDQVLSLLTRIAHHVILDCYQGDFACLCYDGMGRRTADVVAPIPEQACLQAYLFMVAEAKASQRPGKT